MPGFDNNVLFAGNVDFRGLPTISAQVTADGQLLIGSAAFPNIRAGTLTAGNGIAIANGSGSITISSSTMLQQLRASTANFITCDGIIPFDDTIPQQTEGTEVLTLAITPKSATSILSIDFYGSGGTMGDSTSYTIALFQDNVADALSAQQLQWNVNGLYAVPFPLSFYMTSGTTLATTFKIRIGTSIAARPFYLNGSGAVPARKFGGVSIATLTITEYAS